MSRWVDALHLKEGMVWRDRVVTAATMQEDGSVAVTFDDGDRIEVLRIDDSLAVEETVVDLEEWRQNRVVERPEDWLSPGELDLLDLEDRGES